MDLVVEVYTLTSLYPREELFGLTAHSRKTAISIPSNIAEGKRRGTDLQLLNFLRISFASGAELETQIEIAKRLSYANLNAYLKVEILLDEVMRMLNVLITNVHVGQAGV
jgi:four helix bundle protein